MCRDSITRIIRFVDVMYIIFIISAIDLTCFIMSFNGLQLGKIRSRLFKKWMFLQERGKKGIVYRFPKQKSISMSKLGQFNDAIAIFISVIKCLLLFEQAKFVTNLTEGVVETPVSITKIL